MGIAEVAIWTAAQQLAQAGAAYLGRISPPPTNPWAAAAVAVGQQLAANAATAFGYAITAAEAEFGATQSAEAAVVSELGTLPPIT